MQSEIALAPESGADIVETVMLKGDLSKLTAQERVTYYKEVCESLGLNPLTRPFEYVTYQGKLVLYARRDCADQLRKLHRISVEILNQRMDGELFTVHVRAQDRTGRRDEDLGSVALAGLKGEARANAQMKALTKAKRRVTLSIAGLGFSDETELGEDVAFVPTADTTEVLNQFASELSLLERARTAARRGRVGFGDFWVPLKQDQRNELRPHMEELQQLAEAADDEPEPVGR